MAEDPFNQKGVFGRLKEGAEKGLLTSNAIQKHPSAAKAGADFKALAARLSRALLQSQAEAEFFSTL